ATHDWVSIPDPDEERTWLFDVTFLTSRWTCIFGRGCQGVLREPAPEMEQGCCSYGAHFTDDDDVARVEEAAGRLSADQWQYMARARRTGTTRRSGGATVTRIADGACIFLNRPGFPGGSGCALHRAALERGERPMDLKPDVCWQLPLRREDLVHGDGHVLSTVGEWGRRNWGQGGREFAWWCTEAPEAFTGARPVYRAMAEELEAMVGPAVYALLVKALARRLRAGTALPHPAVRRR
ncbi:MAG TPA: hypothetical protein VFH45_03955, partial [Acidimicrobiales bacterium]|nr:hypothetical protein [Acidimicrobiales bacterium]